MGNPSKYKEDILKLRSEGNTYKEIEDKLGCSQVTISYHVSKKSKEKIDIRSNIYRISGKTKISRDKLNNRNRKTIENYLSIHPCVDCGNSDIRVLEFDHIKGNKKGNISCARTKAWSIKKLLDEIDKCEVRCANCHRIVTHERRKNKTTK